jgi:hypothetical protein
MQGIRARQRQIPSTRGVPTCNRFAALEPNTDRAAREMAATPTVHAVKEEDTTIAAVQEEETLPFILVRSCGPRRRSTKLKLQLESIDSHCPHSVR